MNKQILHQTKTHSSIMKYDGYELCITGNTICIVHLIIVVGNQDVGTTDTRFRKIQYVSDHWENRIIQFHT